MLKTKSPNKKRTSKKTTPQHPYQNRKWQLSHGIHVQTHNYDGMLYAFEVTQQGKCLGTMIPHDKAEMERIVYILDNNYPIDGFPCNDGFGTVIRVKKSH